MASSGSAPRPDERPKGLVEGDLEVFGLKLPVRSEVLRRTPRMLVAVFPGNEAAARDYFAGQLVGASAKSGPKGGFDFDGVHAKSSSSGPKLWVSIRKRRNRVEVTVQRELGRAAPAASVAP